MVLKIFVVIFLVYTSSILVICSPFQHREKCAHNTYPPARRPEIRNYVINLDLPPEQRWQQIGRERSAEIANVLDTYKKIMLAMSSEFQHVINFLDKYVGVIVEIMPMPYRDEIKGLSKASRINLGELLFFNTAYEIFAWCTSIVAKAPNGTLYHARNMDFGRGLGHPENHTWPLTEALRPDVIALDWQRNNRTVFKSVNFAGYIGLQTAIKPGAFTFSLNLRRSIFDGGYIGIIKWLMGDRSDSWVSFLTRQTLEDATSYEQAKHLLSNTTTLAPVYFILGGTKSHEACVITRSREKAIDVWDIGTSSSKWFILETNYDHWKPAPASDDRRSVANHCMKKMTQQRVGFAGLFDVLSSVPVLNTETVYTTLMQVDAGLMETYIQYCPDPCIPL